MSHPSHQAALFKAELQQFTGDLERYRSALNSRLLYTPGVKFLADAAGAYWLIDAVGGWLIAPLYRVAVREDERIGWLHFWKLTVHSDQSALLTARVDADEPPFITQKIAFTDFCLDEIDLWCAYDGAYWTLYLPREH